MIVKTHVAEEGVNSINEVDVFDRYVRTATPVIFRGLAADWPCTKHWTKPYLRSRFGDEPVALTAADGRTRTATLREYLDQGGAEWYLTDWNIRRGGVELLNDARWPKFFAVDWLQHVPIERRPDLLWIYIGHAGTLGPTHRDNYGASAWLAVLEGHKRLRFVVGPSGTNTSLRHVDLFDETAVERAAISCAEASLFSGDVLFLPADHWHAARNETYCLSLTANFVDGASFATHRRFTTRGWYGDLMLGRAVDEWLSMPDGRDRAQLKRHLDLAIDGCTRQLNADMGRLRHLARVLDA